jgi:hypothetical protein
MTTHSSQSILFSLLDKNQGFALDARGTTNHCPMALVALEKMGASDQRLQDFYDFWSQNFRLPRDQASQQKRIQSWTESLGCREDFHALQEYFRLEISLRSAQSVVVDVLNSGAFAPATGAFHALIRLAYGLEIVHVGEIAAGLAFFVCANLPMAQSQALLPRSGSSEKLSVTQRLSLFHHQFKGECFNADSITARLKLVANDPKFWRTQAQIEQVLVTDTMLDEMAIAAIRLYIQTKNFTVLHMVTSVAALRTLITLVPTLNHVQIIESFWLAFCAAYVSVGAPELMQEDVVPLDAEYELDAEEIWQKYRNLALNSNDDHMIKLTFTCWVEDRQRRLPTYLQAMAVLHGK